MTGEADAAAAALAAGTLQYNPDHHVPAPPRGGPRLRQPRRGRLRRPPPRRGPPVPPRQLQRLRETAPAAPRTGRRGLLFAGFAPKSGFASRRAGLPVFAPPGPAHLADGLRCASRRAGRAQQGRTLLHPKPAWLLPSAFRGLPSPGPRGFPGAVRPRASLWDLPGPKPRVHFLSFERLRAAMRIEAYGLYAQK